MNYKTSLQLMQEKGKEILSKQPKISLEEAKKQVLWLKEQSMKKKVLKGAKDFGVKLKLNKALDKYSNKTLFPEKLEQANKILSNTKLINLK